MNWEAVISPAEKMASCQDFISFGNGLDMYLCRVGTMNEGVSSHLSHNNDQQMVYTMFVMHYLCTYFNAVSHNM